MLKTYLESLKSAFKKFAEKREIFDVVLYGSAAKGKEDARDTDILLIFNKKSLKERSETGEEFKKIIDKIKNADIKTINLEELFNKDFIARQGILVEGYSLIHSKHFSKLLGFLGYSLFTYNLKNLNHNEKTKFTYALIGRNEEGIIKKIGAESIGKGVVIVPSFNSSIMEEFLEKWKINYNKKNILVSSI